MTIIPPTSGEPLQHDEDVARSDMYGLLGTLFYAPPTPAMIAQLRSAEEAAPESDLAVSWDAFIASARALDASTIHTEYDALFGGVGKPNVYLFGSHYLAGFLNEKPLVRLRDDLIALGLTREQGVLETEDHIAYLCEVMRYLISNSADEASSLMQQREFYAVHIRPWADELCDAIGQQPSAQFYARVAELFRDFNKIESQGFDMLM